MNNVLSIIVVVVCGTLGEFLNRDNVVSVLLMICCHYHYVVVRVLLVFGLILLGIVPKGINFTIIECVVYLVAFSRIGCDGFHGVWSDV